MLTGATGTWTVSVRTVVMVVGVTLVLVIVRYLVLRALYTRVYTFDLVIVASVTVVTVFSIVELCIVGVI